MNCTLVKGGTPKFFVAIAMISIGLAYMLAYSLNHPDLPTPTDKHFGVVVTLIIASFVAYVIGGLILTFGKNLNRLPGWDNLATPQETEGARLVRVYNTRLAWRKADGTVGHQDYWSKEKDTKWDMDYHTRMRPSNDGTTYWIEYR